MRRLLVTLGLLAATTLVGPARPAYACSCAMVGTDKALQEADTAFVGTLVSRDDPPPLPGGLVNSGASVAHRFAVEQVVKGSLGPSVTVYAPIHGASCGLGDSTRRRGLFLHRGEGGEWRSGLCSTVDADQLVRAGRDAERRLPLAVAALVLLAGVGTGTHMARRSVRRSG